LKDLSSRFPEKAEFLKCFDPTRNTDSELRTAMWESMPPFPKSSKEVKKANSSSDQR
jgi:hypothetical protein